MKRSVNFNGFQAKHRHKYNTAADFVATCRAVGVTDEEIRAAVWKSQGKCIKCGEPAYQRNGKTYALCAVHGLEAIKELIASVSEAGHPTPAAEAQ